MLFVTQNILRNILPVVYGWITKIIYFGKNVSIGKNFKVDSVPRILIDKNATLIIEDNVTFRRNVEIRVHNNSRLSVGNFVMIDRSVRILSTNASIIQIEDKVKIGLNSVLNGGDSIHIGKSCLISGYVYIQTSMHGYANKNVSVQNQGYIHKSVVLEEDCWLGTHVVILPGVVLSKGTVVGSNSVVNKNFPEFSVIAGAPAKVIKERDYE